MPTVVSAAVNVKRFPTASFSGATVTLTGGSFSGLGSGPAIAGFQATTGLATTCHDPGRDQARASIRRRRSGVGEHPELANADNKGRGTISNLSQLFRRLQL